MNNVPAISSRPVERHTYVEGKGEREKERKKEAERERRRERERESTLGVMKRECDNRLITSELQRVTCDMVSEAEVRPVVWGSRGSVGLGV